MATLRKTGGVEEALRRIAAKLDKPATLRVGFLEGATYPDGTSVAAVATYNEFGRTVRVKNEHPLQGELGGDYYQLPRPFFRNTIAAKSGGWPKAIARQLKLNEYDVDATLEKVGQGIKGQLQKSIRDLVSPPLAASTIRAKGFDKPLIDTGHMLNSVDYEIKS